MASTYLTRTPSSAGNRRTLTISAWIKLAGLGTNRHIICEEGAGTEKIDEIKISNADVLRIENYNDTANDYSLVSTQLFRDVSAWYHLVVAFDSTQATASDRIKVYLNGSQITSFSTETYPSQNHDFYWNSNLEKVGIGADTRTPTNYFDGSMTHVHLIDGTAYDASTFGETDATTGIWKPKTAPSVTYGTNGFFLKFENSGSMGTDSSGNANNFTVNGTLTQTVDTPSNVFATLNSIDRAINGTAPTFANGNTRWTASGDSTSNNGVKGTLGVSKGKWYWEVKFNTAQATNVGMFQINGTAGWNSDGDIYTNTGFYGIQSGGSKRVAGVNTPSVFTALSDNDIGMFAYDLDNNKFWFGVNGSWVASGDPANGTNSLGTLATGTYLPILSNGSWSVASSTSFNFGNGYFGTTAVSSAENPDDGIGIFEYDVPAGYRALCTKSINAEEYS